MRQRLIPFHVVVGRATGRAIGFDQILRRYRSDRPPARVPRLAVGHHQDPAEVEALRADRGQLPIDQSAGLTVFVKNIAGLEIAMDDPDRRFVRQPRCQQCAEFGARGQPIGVLRVPQDVLPAVHFLVQGLRLLPIGQGPLPIDGMDPRQQSRRLKPDVAKPGVVARKRRMRLPDQEHPPGHAFHHQEGRSQLVLVRRSPGDFRDRQPSLLQGAHQRGLPENIGIAPARDPDRRRLQDIGAERRTVQVNQFEAEGKAGMAVFHDAEIDHPGARAAFKFHHALQPVGQAGRSRLFGKRRVWNV